LKTLFHQELGDIQEQGKADISSSLVAEIQRRNENSQRLGGGAKKRHDAKTAKLEVELKRVQSL